MDLPLAAVAALRGHVRTTPFTENPAAWAAGLLLPWLVLGLTTSTAYARYTRGQMVETLGEDYVRTAVAKGASDAHGSSCSHALRAAIVPVITIFGLDFAFLLAGTIFTEVIFDIDGIGQLGHPGHLLAGGLPGRRRDRPRRPRCSS